MKRIGRTMAVAALGVAVLMSACGQKGPLYLPDKAAETGASKEAQPRSATGEPITTPAIPTAPAPAMTQ